MQPLISYWPATMSPGLSCGRKEYALPQYGHQPSDSALPSSLDRPTGLPQFQQNRLDSATTGLVINASSGSMSGTRGISTRPPPSRGSATRRASPRSCWSCGSVSDGWRMRDVVVVIVEVGPEHRLGGHRAHRRRRVARSRLRRAGCPGPSSSGRVAGRRPVFCGPSVGSAISPRTSASGGAGAGPSTVNHLRYNVFHVPSRRMRSSVPLTNRTRPVLSRLIPMP